MSLGKFGLFSLMVLALGIGTSACRSPAESPPELPVGTDPGMRAPPLFGLLPSGEPFTLDRGAGPAVVVFVRGAVCGLCRFQLEQMQQNLPAYRRLRVQVIAATLDSPALTRQLLDQLMLEFEVVSVDSAAFSGWSVSGGERDLVMPATYIIDSAGVVRYRHIGRNASDRTQSAEILTVLETLDNL